MIFQFYQENVFCNFGRKYDFGVLAENMVLHLSVKNDFSILGEICGFCQKCDSVILLGKNEFALLVLKCSSLIFAVNVILHIVKKYDFTLSLEKNDFVIFSYCRKILTNALTKLKIIIQYSSTDMKWK